MNLKIFESLYTRLLILLIVLALLPMMILSGIGYRFFSNLMIEMIAESNMQTVRQVENKIDATYSEINDVLLKTSIHPEIQSIFSNEPKSQWEAYREARFFVDYTRLLMIGNLEIENITLLNDRGKRLDSKGRFLNTSYLPAPQVYNEIAAKLKSGTDPMVISSVYKQTGKDLISFGKIVLDLHTGRPIGYIVVDLNLQVLHSELKKVNLLKSGKIVLLNNSGQIIYHPEGNTGHPMQEAWMRAHASNQYYLQKDKGVQSLYLKINVKPVPWTLYGIVPYAEIQAETMSIRDKFYLFVAIIVSAITIIALLMRKLFVKPILKLQQLMRRVQTGDYFVRANSERKDEIGDLGNSFNNMVIRLEELIEKVYMGQLNESKALLLQKQAELEALQAHITPHFLYNTLNSISWFANRKGIREIQAVVDSLSSILRYSLSNTPKMVRLADEYEYLKMYMDIIRFRYGNMIRFSYDLPVELREILIPRLSLQPIVENSIKHAFEGMTGEEHIQIAATLQGSEVYINISDNGRGMTEKTLALLTERLNAPVRGRDGDQEEHAVTGMGLLNVHYRMKLSFGEKFGLQIRSEEERGTQVTLKIPCRVASNDSFPSSFAE